VLTVKPILRIAPTIGTNGCEPFFAHIALSGGTCVNQVVSVNRITNLLRDFKPLLSPLLLAARSATHGHDRILVVANSAQVREARAVSYRYWHQYFSQEVGICEGGGQTKYSPDNRHRLEAYLLPAE
jgi:hypothetical protein